MEAKREPDWAAQLAAAQAWWREAGVDLAFEDAPRDWLAGAANASTAEKPAATIQPIPVPPPQATRIGGERSRWPTDLGAFADWWLTEPTLDPGGGAFRVAPAGPRNAPLMVIVAQPETGDRDTLLSGPQGRLLDAILRAFELDRARVYLASVLPRPAPMIDWVALAESGMAEVVAHHIALAAPARVLVFGRGGISALLGHDPAQAAPASLQFNQEGASVPLAFAPALETLLARPALKQGVWTRWLEWTGSA